MSDYNFTQIRRNIRFSPRVLRQRENQRSRKRSFGRDWSLKENKREESPILKFERKFLPKEKHLHTNTKSFFLFVFYFNLFVIFWFLLLSRNSAVWLGIDFSVNFVNNAWIFVKTWVEQLYHCWLDNSSDSSDHLS